jgi:hypothetical protein
LAILKKIKNGGDIADGAEVDFLGFRLSSFIKRIIKPDTVLERFFRELSDLLCPHSNMAEKFKMAVVKFLSVLA